MPLPNIKQPDILEIVHILRLKQAIGDVSRDLFFSQVFAKVGESDTKDYFELELAI